MDTVLNNNRLFVDELAILRTISFSENVYVEDDSGTCHEAHIRIEDNNHLLETAVRLSDGQVMIRFPDLSVKASVCIKEVEVEMSAQESYKRFVYSVITMEREAVRTAVWHQCFVSLPKEKINYLFRHFRTHLYQAGNIKYYNHCFTIENVPYPFSVFYVEDKVKNYLLIETKQGLLPKVFEGYCDMILSGLGFVTGIFPGGEIYCFTNEGGFFRTYSNRPSGSFPRFKIYPDRTLYSELPDPFFPGKDFGNLISVLYKEPSFYSVFTLLLECIMSGSGVLKAGMLAVIMESLSKLICEKEEGKVRPLRSQKVFREIKMKFYDQLASYRDAFETEEEYIKFKRRISELNKPVNKQFLTNTEKLLQPFEQLRIKLTLKDREAIEHRNDLLHGSFYLPDEDEVKMDENYMEDIFARLYTLTGALILKYTGYSGYIVEHAVLLKKIRKIETEDAPYREI